MKKIEYYMKYGNIDFNTALCQIAQICKYGKNCRGKHCEDCEFHGNENGILKELLDEYKEPIKLTKFEYDLISIYKATDNKFIGFRVLCELKEKGYYKNVDVGMRICEILNNCEVVENVD